ncbi:MAG: hypothetical protein KY462_07280 [Actinobacteria bacterium]|nr:hypothetical protein [Actinomycetota bacterium]
MGDDRGAAGRRLRLRRTAAVALMTAALVAILALVGVVLSGDGPPGRPAASPEPIASADGIVLRRLVVTDALDPRTGQPAAPRDRFEIGERVVVWVDVDYDRSRPGRDVLRFVFTRTDADVDELFTSTVRMPQPLGTAAAGLSAAYTQQPGRYQVTVYANDQPLASADFTVAA